MLYGKRVIRMPCYRRAIAIFAPCCYMGTVFSEDRAIRGLTILLLYYFIIFYLKKSRYEGASVIFGYKK